MVDSERLKSADELHPDGVICLVGKIIEAAVDDYRRALEMDIRGLKIDCERFFTSEYFFGLTHLDGGYIMERVQRENAEETRS